MTRPDGPHYRTCVIYPRNCAECGTLFIARHSRRSCCSDTCGEIRRRRRANKSTPRTRNKRHVRRSIEKYTDITSAFESILRSKARKCPLCRTYLTSKSDRPNSKQLDHIIPLAIGGTHTIGNVRIICRTCNLKRPKDGSDLTGWQPTLWAQVAEVMMPPAAQATPKIPARKPPRVATCQCGIDFQPHGPQDRCGQCLDRLTLEASAMREGGMKWQEICDALGYPNTGSLYGRVMRIRRSASAAA